MGCCGSKNHVYSVPISSPEDSKGETPIYRKPEFASGLKGTPDIGITTMQEAYEKSFQKFKNYNCFAKRELLPDGKLSDFKWITYGQVYNKATEIGHLIEVFSLYSRAETTIKGETKHMALVGIYARTSLEWGLIDVACALYGYTTVPVYDTLGEDGIQYIFESTELTSCFVHSDLVKKVLELKSKDKTGKLKEVIVLDSEAPSDQMKRLEEAGIKAILLEEYIDQARNSGKELTKKRQVAPSDVYSFCYTSGTTGQPKAAMLLHSNFVSEIQAGKEGFAVKSSDVFVGFLPMAHSMERAVHVIKLYNGASTAYFQGDILKLKEDILLAKPTVIIAVPRLFNRLVDGIKQKLNELPKKKKNFVLNAFQKKIQKLKKTGVYTHFLYDKLVMSKIRAGFGGRVRFMLTGSAPISQDVLEYMKVAMCHPLIQGYGLTETTGGSFCTVPQVNELNIGGPVGVNEFKLVDIPEMSYFSTDKDEQGRSMPRGEVWIRGHNIFAGYYQAPEKTEEMLTSDGWLRTGDVGCIDSRNGALKIIDRKKNIFKLAQGEYIAPEKLESIYCKVEGLSEIFVYGDSLHGHLVAIGVPNDPVLIEKAQSLGVQGSIEEICSNMTVKEHLVAEMGKLASKFKLNGLERIKKLHLDPCQTLNNHGLLTTTMKLIRHQAKNKYQSIIDEMYQEK